MKPPFARASADTREQRSSSSQVPSDAASAGFDGALWRNWSRTQVVRPRRVERPQSVGEVQQAVAQAVAEGRRIKAVGSGHSFSDIAVAEDVLLDTAGLEGLVAVEPERGRATLRAGTPLHRLPDLLGPFRLALPNLCDIDRQTIAGAIATGTHGTGGRVGGLSTFVVGVTVVTASGDLLVVDEENHPELLPAMAVSLGALGILVDVTLQCVPAFVLHALERPEPLDDVLGELAARTETADHFEFFWFPHTDRPMTKTYTRLPADAPRHPLPRAGRWIDDVLVGTVLHQGACSVGRRLPSIVPAINALAVRMWGDREFTDASSRVFVSARAVRFHEMEWALPIAHVAEAFAEVRDLVTDLGWRISFPVEVRFAPADEVWLSNAYGRSTGYIAVHRYAGEDPTDYFEAVELIMLAYGGRPHWGKHHGLGAETLGRLYPRFADFIAVRDRLDPGRSFSNPHLQRVLGG